MREIFTIVFFGILGVATEKAKKEENKVSTSDSLKQREISYLEKRIDEIKIQIGKEENLRKFSCVVLIILMFLLTASIYFAFNLNLETNDNLQIASCLIAIFSINIPICFSIYAEQNSKIYNLNCIISEYEYKIKQLEGFQND